MVGDRVKKRVKAPGYIAGLECARGIASDSGERRCSVGRRAADVGHERAAVAAFGSGEPFASAFGGAQPGYYGNADGFAPVVAAERVPLVAVAA